MGANARRSLATTMKRLAAFIAFGSVITITLVLLLSDWFAQRLMADFWPLDSSRVGPNLVASAVQWVIVVIVASFVYPPLRKWIENELQKLHDKLDRNGLLSHHIIKHHPDIPDYPKEK